jgi:hypothetical protein
MFRVWFEPIEVAFNQRAELARLLAIVEAYRGRHITYSELVALALGERTENLID